MKYFLNWWNDIPNKQKSGLLVLAAFIVGTLIMMFGIEIGQTIGKLL